MDHIQNPRRTPRAPARCRARLTFADGSHLDADTEDVSAMGCQVIVPRAVPVDTHLSLQLTATGVDHPLVVQAHVAWVSEVSPYRAGIAVEKNGQKACSRWYEALLKADPRLSPRRVPDKIPGNATLYLGAPPRHVVDFSADEVEVLRHVAGGATASSLRTSFRDRWSTAQYAVFSLLARRSLTLERGSAAHPDAWRSILQQAEASLALESLGGAGPAWAAEARPAASAPAAPATPAPAAPAPARPASRAAPPREPAAPPRPPRSPGAQALYDKAMAQLDEGKFAPARFALEQALNLSPGDPDIARALARAVSRERAKPS
jgi:hypothetical protein